MERKVERKVVESGVENGVVDSRTECGRWEIGMDSGGVWSVESGEESKLQSLAESEVCSGKWIESGK